MTSGGAVTAAPLPANRNQLRFIRLPVAVGWRKTTNRRWVPSGTVSGRSIVTSVHVCQPPVGAMFGVSATTGPFGSSNLSWIVPPAPAEATRKVTLSRSSRLYGLKEIQSPSSMNAAALPPPTSVVASSWTPGSPVPMLSAVAPGGREELGLLELRLEDHLAGPGQRAGASPAPRSV